MGALRLTKALIEGSSIVNKGKTYSTKSAIYRTYTREASAHIIRNVQYIAGLTFEQFRL